MPNFVFVCLLLIYFYYLHNTHIFPRRQFLYFSRESLLLYFPTQYSYFWAPVGRTIILKFPVRQPGGQPPAGRPAGPPAGRPAAGQPASQPASQPAGQPASQPTSCFVHSIVQRILALLYTHHPISQSANPPTSQPISQSVNQPINQSANRPVSQSANRPIRQAAMGLCSRSHTPGRRINRVPKVPHV